MKNVNQNNLIKLMAEITPKKTSFEVKPLDVYLAKIQYNLINRLEREVPEYGDFAPVIEKYTSKSPRQQIGDIVVQCTHVQDSETKLDRSLDITVFDRYNPEKFMKHNIVTGNKKDILEAVKQKEFFETCKKTTLEFDETLKSQT